MKTNPVVDIPVVLAEEVVIQHQLLQIHVVQVLMREF